MVPDCPISEDLPVLCEILTEEIYPTARIKKQYVELFEIENRSYDASIPAEAFEDENICKLPDVCVDLRDGKVGGPELNVGQDCSKDLKWNEWAERDIVDDLTGELLPPDLVSKAKVEELLEVYRRGVWTEVSVDECWNNTFCCSHQC